MNLPCRAALLLSTLGLMAAAHAAAPAAGRAQGAALTALPEARLPAAEVRQSVQRLKGEALRFAVAADLQQDERNGQWDAPSQGIARWRLRIESEGARSLALSLTGLQLPKGAAIWFYDANGGDAQGPFDRDSELLNGDRLQLPVVRSARAVLEVQLPAAQREALRLTIDKAYHGYRALTAVAADAESTPAKASIGGDSGFCNVNVVCPQGNNWRDEIRSAVLLTIGNTTLCSGTLVSNTRQDDRPLILTANHCQLRSSNVANTLAYFNVQSQTCTGNENGRVDQFGSGQSLLARDDQSDFTLFTLASAPPASYNVYYAGWDARSGVVPQSGVTIHHPQGDEKKISTYSTPAVARDNVVVQDSSGNFSVNAWQVVWSNGTTEAGSSGAALWSQNHQLVGVLSGGGASCMTQGEPDFFARFEQGWQASSASSGQLKAHLDPINTGCLQLNGKNPGSASPVAACVTPPPVITDPRTFTDGGGSLGAMSLFWLLLLRLRRGFARA